MEYFKLSCIKKQIDRDIESYLENFGKEGLYDAIKYPLCSFGKRLRPIFAHIIAESIGKGFSVKNSALAVEFFHTATLIADDLPCMDNDDFRRGRPSLHKKYGESTAVLTSFALLTEGFALIEANGKDYSKKGGQFDAKERTCLAIRKAASLAGPKGTILGQYFDLAKVKPQTEEDFENLHYLKTGTLFQGAFTMGYIFGGGDLEKLALVEKLSKHIGFAYQLRDDLEDVGEQNINYANAFGENAAKQRCEKEIESFYQALDCLDLKKELFEALINYLFPKQKLQAFSHGLL
jgi:geranylgeranyl diphosphate synthase type II